jgi:hypothetical protein
MVHTEKSTVELGLFIWQQQERGKFFGKTLLQDNVGMAHSTPS